jgi:hypothetical protein
MLVCSNTPHASQAGCPAGGQAQLRIKGGDHRSNMVKSSLNLPKNKNKK